MFGSAMDTRSGSSPGAANADSAQADADGACGANGADGACGTDSANGGGTNADGARGVDMRGANVD